ncbi:uncharacterized protein LOC124711756 [Schistocerca piceifrons]|uniref:uncharacterized protein LOC124711756 n=1 Tax=Schistocerca piceifrons TaxID=274613 RepID=UPI001F5EB6C8|nr:uncharacterized protein LOC124711756 [Schistocerca piceifrons]
MLDNATLILAVKKRPCLWDTSHKYYTDQAVKRRAWEDIAKSFFEDWDEIPPSDQQAAVEEVQRKWKSIRDYYTREKRREADGLCSIPSNRLKRNPYFELMTFFQPSRRSTKSLVKYQHEPTEEYVTEELSEDFTEGFSNQSQEATQLQGYSLQEVPTKKRRAISYTESTDEVEAYYQETTADVDANKSFLLSFVPEMQRMTERQNFEFRMAIMNALNKIVYQIPADSGNS